MLGPETNDACLLSPLPAHLLSPPHLLAVLRVADRVSNGMGTGWGAAVSQNAGLRFVCE
jgi:hypothetical protein